MLRSDMLCAFPVVRLHSVQRDLRIPQALPHSMYYQVVDMGGREGNYLETSGSCMIAYAMLKGARLGILRKEYAARGKKTFDGVVGRYLDLNADGIKLGGICSIQRLKIRRLQIGVMGKGILKF